MRVLAFALLPFFLFYPPLPLEEPDEETSGGENG